MLTIEPENGYEKYLIEKALATHTPISGSFELLPTCNMDCRMCYIRMSPDEMRRSGTPLPTPEWIRIGEEAVKSGTVYLLLTGGEPLMHRDFGEIYTQLRKMGIILTINTNGTLINDKTIALLRQNMPRRVNVSLYGSSDEVYAALCRNPHGYTQVMKGIRMLLDADIPVKLNYTLTPQNIKEKDKISEISDSLGIPVSTPVYMFPPTRKADNNEALKHFCRMTPCEAAQMAVSLIEMNRKGDPNFKEGIQSILQEFEERESNQTSEAAPSGFLCSAGKRSFWVNWKGEMTACGMYPFPMVDLRSSSFSEAWERIVRESNQIHTADKCFHCKFRLKCFTCVSAAYAETGDSTGVPEYLCEYFKEFERLLNDLLSNQNKNEEQ